MTSASLNPEQRRAVDHGAGPLLVLAGAGSGKTRVITHRIARLLETGVDPRTIVAVTFTTKAAGELRERLRKMVGKEAAGGLVLGTFHSIGARMMRSHPEAFGVPKRFSILDQGDALGIMRAVLRECGVHAAGKSRRFDVMAVLQRVSLWKNEFLSNEQIFARVKRDGSEYDVAAATAFEAYEDRLRSLGAVDFDDLVCHVADVLGRDEALAAEFRAQMRWFLVDEYQDTNHAQFEFLRRLIGDERNLCVVGDDDQAIYGWRGAKVSHILSFSTWFPDAVVVKLEANYRSTPSICRAANAVIAKNHQRFDKRLVPTRGDASAVRLVRLHDPGHEASWVGEQIQRLVAQDGVGGHEIAVLYRSTRQSRLIEATLQAHGVPFRILGGQTVWDRKEIKDIVAYLRCILTPGDETALRRAIDTPARGIGRKTIERLAEWAKANDKRLMDAVVAHARIEDLGARQTQALARFAELLRTTREAMVAAQSAVAPLRTLLDAIALKDNLQRDTGSAEATRARWEGVESFFVALERFEERTPGGPFAKRNQRRWRDWMAAIAGEQSDSEEGASTEDDAPVGVVTLSTVHSAKGLEWANVFVIGCEEGTMPHPRAEAARISDAVAGDLEEERRLFYVAVTRARDHLALTYSAFRTATSGDLEVIPSRFVAELDEDVLHRIDLADAVPLAAIEQEDLANAFLAKLAALDVPPQS